MIFKHETSLFSKSKLSEFFLNFKIIISYIALHRVKQIIIIEMYIGSRNNVVLYQFCVGILLKYLTRLV